MRKFTSFALMGVLASAAANAAVLCNFEPPTYTAGQDINSGQDGWIRFGSVNGRVTPDTASGYVPPTYPILEGSQSFVLYTSGGGYAHPWGAAGAELGDGAVVSYLMRTELRVASGGPGFYISDNIAGGQTPAGLEFNEATGHIELFGLGGNVDSGYAYSQATNYKIELELNFTSDQYTAYATDLSNSGARTLLGTKGFYTDMNVATTAASGGIFLGKFSGPAWFADDIEVNPVPEPASLGLVGLALACGMRRRRS